MLKLMAKYQNGEWEEIDSIDPKNPSPTEQSMSLKDRKNELLNQYRDTLGHGWDFKWV